MGIVLTYFWKRFPLSCKNISMCISKLIYLLILTKIMSSVWRY
nr:MAG TPA: hypothetical protein [Caudoviricetes sp.]